MEGASDLANAPLSRVELCWAIRPGWATAGAVAHERRYRDFVVDGRSLLALLGGGDFVTPFGWLNPWIEEEAAQRLLLAVPGRLEGGRQELYVCPECADLGCGALTAVVERVGDLVIWRDFGYQREPEDTAVDREGYDTVGPLAFERIAYERAIRSALGRERDGPA